MDKDLYIFKVTMSILLIIALIMLLENIFSLDSFILIIIKDILGGIILPLFIIIMIIYKIRGWKLSQEFNLFVINKYIYNFIAWVFIPLITLILVFNIIEIVLKK